MSSLGQAANLHLIRGTLLYLIQHISHDVTSLLFFSAFCIHERYCPLPHSATPPNISTHTQHTTYQHSSAAQGGGGSFKESKLSEVGCCDSWITEQIH